MTPAETAGLTFAEFVEYVIRLDPLIAAVGIWWFGFAMNLSNTRREKADQRRADQAVEDSKVEQGMLAALTELIRRTSPPSSQAGPRARRIAPGRPPYGLRHPTRRPSVVGPRQLGLDKRLGEIHPSMSTSAITRPPHFPQAGLGISTRRAARMASVAKAVAAAPFTLALGPAPFLRGIDASKPYLQSRRRGGKVRGRVYPDRVAVYYPDDPPFVIRRAGRAREGERQRESRNAFPVHYSNRASFNRQ